MIIKKRDVYEKILEDLIDQERYEECSLIANLISSVTDEDVYFYEDDISDISEIEFDDEDGYFSEN